MKSNSAQVAKYLQNNRATDHTSKCFLIHSYQIHISFKIPEKTVLQEWVWKSVGRNKKYKIRKIELSGSLETYTSSSLLSLNAKAWISVSPLRFSILQ